MGRRMSSGRGVGVLIALAAPFWALGACSSFEEGDRAPAADAGTAADGASPEPDATVAADAGEGGDGASPCDTPHTFCDDFDDAPLGAKWTGGVYNSGRGELSLGPGLSAPHAMVATLTPFDGGTTTEVYLQKNDFGPFSSLTCSWSVFVEKLPTIGLPDMVSVSISPATPAFASASVVISTSTSETRLSVFENGGDAGNFGVYPKGAALATGTWHRVELRIDGAPTAKVTAKIGPYTLSETFPVAPYPNANLRVRLGQGNVFDNDGATMRFDDFACDLAP